jgi:hypothetical protein
LDVTRSDEFEVAALCGDIHVLPAGDQWLVMRDLSPEPLSSYSSQAEAEFVGRSTARAEHVCFALHDQDGRLRIRVTTTG